MGRGARARVEEVEMAELRRLERLSRMTGGARAERRVHIHICVEDRVNPNPNPSSPEIVLPMATQIDAALLRAVSVP